MSNLKAFFTREGWDLARFGVSYLAGFITWCAAYAPTETATLGGVPGRWQVTFWLTYGAGVNAIAFIVGLMVWRLLGGLGRLVKGVRSWADRRREPEFDRA